jgi:uncharacterized membrane protein
MKFILLILHSFLTILYTYNAISNLQSQNKAVPILWAISAFCWLILVIWDVCNILNDI